ncbi:Uncharacterized protein M6B38_232655 [Iris pallida]|uniref:Uncharacterized protein n=1 Tax=Iris pallida TaxID=29817 RepID=A0AAX6DRR0_IRIPA|nr:Uncharacterized protein M6B38_232655 [Iris pallida]
MGGGRGRWKRDGRRRSDTTAAAFDGAYVHVGVAAVRAGAGPEGFGSKAVDRGAPAEDPSRRHLPEPPPPPRPLLCLQHRPRPTAQLPLHYQTTSTIKRSYSARRKYCV